MKINTDSRKSRNRRVTWWNTGKYVILFFVLFLLLFRFVIGVSMVSGSSMNPGLVNGEPVIYTRIGNTYSRGDVISVRVPSGDYYVKRIIAVGGDVVDLRDGIVYVNDEALDEPYIQGTTEPEEGAVKYPYTVNEGDVFVMGDNREGSTDSRAFGAVNVSQIKGQLRFHMGFFYIKAVK